VVEFRKGVNHFDCEEFYDAEHCLTRALELFLELPKAWTEGSHLTML
jgi:hypothetical protein